MDETSSGFENHDSESDKPLNWKISDGELLDMSPEARALYLNEKINRIYDDLMLKAEADLSGTPVKPEDTIAVLHPERKDEFDRLRNRDLPEH